jgi:Na+/H+-dicarboxylate symporter
MKRFGLLPKILIAIALGIICGIWLPTGAVRIFSTFNSIFGEFLSFMIPLIILGLVAPAIAEIGKEAGKLLLQTVILAYGFTLLAGILSYGVSVTSFPSFIDTRVDFDVQSQAVTPEPFFTISMPPVMSVMTALILAFTLGLGMAYINSTKLQEVFQEFKEIIINTIESLIIPLLPIYIFGIFLSMTATGEVFRVLKVFAGIIGIIFLLHIFWLLFLYVIAGSIARKNPLRLLKNMLPAYFTALGTQSSAATIPVTLEQTRKNGVSEGIAGFVIPLCATIHLSGSMLKIVACAVALMMMQGIPYGFNLFVGFIFMLGITMVAAPGVPGGAIMAALGVLASMLGFGETDQALMIALYIAMDSFGTACNVTGDGAIALIIDKFTQKKTIK